MTGPRSFEKRVVTRSNGVKAVIRSYKQLQVPASSPAYHPPPFLIPASYGFSAHAEMRLSAIYDGSFIDHHGRPLADADSLTRAR